MDSGPFIFLKCKKLRSREAQLPSRTRFKKGKLGKGTARSLGYSLGDQVAERWVSNGEKRVHPGMLTQAPDTTWPASPSAYLLSEPPRGRRYRSPKSRTSPGPTC